MTLTEGEHTLRVEAWGIVCDANPINYIYMTREQDLDLASLAHDHSAAIIPRPTE